MCQRAIAAVHRFMLELALLISFSPGSGRTSFYFFIFLFLRALVLTS